MAARTRVGFIGSMAAYLGFAPKSAGAVPTFQTDVRGLRQFPRVTGSGSFAELKADVFRRLNESATAPVFWSEDDVELALNEGYAELSDATEWYEGMLEVDLLHNRPYYDLFTIIGPDFLSIKPVFEPSANRWLVHSAVRELDAGVHPEVDGAGRLAVQARRHPCIVAPDSGKVYSWQTAARSRPARCGRARASAGEPRGC